MISLWDVNPISCLSVCRGFIFWCAFRLSVYILLFLLFIFYSSIASFTSGSLPAVYHFVEESFLSYLSSVSFEEHSNQMSLRNFSCRKTLDMLTQPIISNERDDHDSPWGMRSDIGLYVSRMVDTLFENDASFSSRVEENFFRNVPGTSFLLRASQFHDTSVLLDEVVCLFPWGCIVRECRFFIHILISLSASASVSLFWFLFLRVCVWWVG